MLASSALGLVVAPDGSYVDNTPSLPRETGVCLSRRGVDLGDCLFPSWSVADTIQRGFLREATRAGATTVDARKWFCAQGRCPAVVGSTVTMRDKEHVTPGYARSLADPIARTLGVARSG